MYVRDRNGHASLFDPPCLQPFCSIWIHCHWIRIKASAKLLKWCTFLLWSHPFWRVDGFLSMVTWGTPGRPSRCAEGPSRSAPGPASGATPPPRTPPPTVTSCCCPTEPAGGAKNKSVRHSAASQRLQGAPKSVRRSAGQSGVVRVRNCCVSYSSGCV